MAIFHIVPRVIFKSDSNRGYREHYNLSKMSKNSLRSSLIKENRRHEVGISFLNYMSFSWWTRIQIHARLHNLCFAGLKLVCHSIINGLHNSLGPYPLGFLDLCRPPIYAAYISLGQCVMLLNLCLRDMPWYFLDLLLT